MIYVTAVHMTAGGTGHEHIEEVRWRNPGNNNTGASAVEVIAEFIEKNGPGSAQVQGPPAVNIGARTSPSGRKYIQTYADNSWTNNLLSLPRY